VRLDNHVGFGTQPVTSGLPQTTDFARPVRLVRFVPDSDFSDKNCCQATSRLARSFLMRQSMRFRE
jgi:hypothetical protein